MAIGGTFGGYVAHAQIQIQLAQTETIANLNLLKALIPTGTATAWTSVSPDFDKMSPELAVQLRKEIDALIVVIDASPVA